MAEYLQEKRDEYLKIFSEIIKHDDEKYTNLYLNVRKTFDEKPEQTINILCALSFINPLHLEKHRDKVKIKEACILWKRMKINYADDDELVSFVNAINHTKIVKHFSKDLMVGDTFQIEKRFLEYPEKYFDDNDRNNKKNKIQRHIANLPDDREEDHSINNSFKL